MLNRLFPPASAPSAALHAEYARHGKGAPRHQPDGDGNDYYPTPPEKRTHYSIHPIFNKYKQRVRQNDDASIDKRLNPQYRRTSPSPARDSPLIEELKRNYAALRVTLHSNGVKDFVEIGDELAAEAEEKIDASILKVNKMVGKARQLCAPSCECEVDTQITSKDGQQRTRTVQVRDALEKYQELEAERSKQLAQLWSSWEKTQSDIDELLTKLQEFFERDPSQGTSGISSNSEWSNKEDLDIGRRSKQVVEDMTACEEIVRKGDMLIEDKEFQEKLKDEETHILETMLNYSLG